jgi:hypothetical protein
MHTRAFCTSGRGPCYRRVARREIQTGALAFGLSRVRGQADCLTVPCGTASCLVAAEGHEHGCESLDGSLVEDDLVAEPVGLRLDFAASGASE